PSRMRSTMASQPKDIALALVEAANGLAAEGGFDHVRLRDVAERAGVALRTLYKRYASKEELLVPGLTHQGASVERRLLRDPAVNDARAAPEDRLGLFFERATRALCNRPDFAKAVIRASASGVPRVAAHTVAYQERMTEALLAALRGPGAPASAPTE